MKANYLLNAVGRLVAPRLWVAGAAVVLAAHLPAQTLTSYVQTLPGKGSKCQIAGTSSIHDWKMESPILAGTFQVDQAALDNAAGGKVAAQASVRIPVRTLKSYNAKMDEVYKEHMEEAKFKNIEYKLTELTAAQGERKAGTPIEATSKGNLIIHGVTKPVEMPVQILAQAGNQLKISGKTKLKMSDYGVKPPNPKLPIGEITTGDEITIEFDWVVQKQ